MLLWLLFGSGLRWWKVSRGCVAAAAVLAVNGQPAPRTPGAGRESGNRFGVGTPHDESFARARNSSPPAPRPPVPRDSNISSPPSVPSATAVPRLAGLERLASRLWRIPRTGMVWVRGRPRSILEAGDELHVTARVPDRTVGPTDPPLNRDTSAAMVRERPHHGDRHGNLDCLDRHQWRSGPWKDQPPKQRHYEFPPLLVTGGKPEKAAGTDSGPGTARRPAMLRRPRPHSADAGRFS